MKRLYSKNKQLIQPGYWLMQDGFLVDVRANPRQWEVNEHPFEYSEEGVRYGILSENVASTLFLGKVASLDQVDELRANVAQSQPSRESQWTPEPIQDREEAARAVLLDE